MRKSTTLQALGWLLVEPPKWQIPCDGCLVWDFPIAVLIYLHEPVAQLDRASGYEPEGWRFKSSQARHFPNRKLVFQISPGNGCVPFYCGFTKLLPWASAPRQRRTARADDGHNLKTCQRPLIAEPSSQCELHIVGGCGKQYAQLVSEARDQAARRVRCKFVQVYGNHAPRSLHAHLHQHRRGNQQRNAPAKRPERDNRQRNASAHIIPFRRPSTCERCPNMMAPRTAPAV